MALVFTHVLSTLPGCIGCCNKTLLYLWGCLLVHDVPKYIFIQDFFANLALALTTRLVLGSLLGIRTILGPPPQNLPIELAGEAKSPSSWLGRKSEGEIWARRRSLGGHYHPIRTTSQPQQCPTLIIQSTTPRHKSYSEMCKTIFKLLPRRMRSCVHLNHMLLSYLFTASIHICQRSVFFRE